MDGCDISRQRKEDEDAANYYEAALTVLDRWGVYVRPGAPYQDVCATVREYGLDGAVSAYAPDLYGRGRFSTL